jgi:hypothetical protein
MSVFTQCITAFPLLHGKNMAIVFYMNTSSDPTAIPKRKRGPAKRLPPMVSTHIFMPMELLDWAKQEPEGLGALVRHLLAQERARRAPRCLDGAAR